MGHVGILLVSTNEACIIDCITSYPKVFSFRVLQPAASLLPNPEQSHFPFMNVIRCRYCSFHSTLYPESARLVVVRLVATFATTKNVCLG